MTGCGIPEFSASPKRDLQSGRRHRPERRPLLIGSEIYRRSSYGHGHPLAIPRVSAALDLIRAMGWLAEEAYIDSPQATPGQLARFHDPDYIAAVRQAEAEPGMPEDRRRRFGIGCNGNPVFPEVFRRPATAWGATLKAVELLRDPGIVYSPAGGTHHRRRDRASGFCYFNDPVLGILAFLDRGLRRVYYVDVDAHHCDGVQDAFAGDPRVLTLSIHEAGRWPYTGAAADRAIGLAPRLFVLGGGGYTPWAVAPTPAAQSVLGGLSWARSPGRNPPEHWLKTIADDPRPGSIREAVRAVAATALRP